MGTNVLWVKMVGKKSRCGEWAFLRGGKRVGFTFRVGGGVCVWVGGGGMGGEEAPPG